MEKVNQRLALIEQLERVEKLKPARWTSRVQDIQKGTKYPYQYLLLLSLCIAAEAANERMLTGKFSMSDVLPIYSRLLLELPSEFINLRLKRDEIAQPISRLTKSGFWSCFTGDNSEIDFSTESRVNSIKYLPQLERKDFSYCKLDTKLKDVLLDSENRKVLVAFLSTKIKDCLP